MILTVSLFLTVQVHIFLVMLCIRFGFIWRGCQMFGFWQKRSFYLEKCYKLSQVWFGMIWIRNYKYQKYDCSFFGSVWSYLVWLSYVGFGLVLFGLVLERWVRFGLIWFGLALLVLVWSYLVWFWNVGFCLVLFGLVWCEYQIFCLVEKSLIEMNSYSREVQLT